MQGHILSTLSSLRADKLPDTIRQTISENRKVASVVIAIIVIFSIGLIAIIPGVTNASETNLLMNGSFEHPFTSVSGCGAVGTGWDCFTNGGVANYGFYDDEWDLVVADGEHSQLIEINTKGMAAGDQGRYAGLSQTVRVKPRAKYKFSMQGMIRTSNIDSEDKYRYVVEFGYVDAPNAHWKDVEDWQDTGWYSYAKLDEPNHMAGFYTELVPESEVITVFIRVWKKWGVPNEELDVNIDNVALTGPAFRPNTKSGPQVKPKAPSAKAIVVDPRPSAGIGGACETREFISNGDFEGGFLHVGYGAVGRGWGQFTNGGAANYGFYDEQWEAVISSDTRTVNNCQQAKPNNPCASTRAISTQAIEVGPNQPGCSYTPSPCDCDDDDCSGHGQLIEINTKNQWPADSDRYAGIYQRIGGLTPGAPYTLRLKGLLRGTGDEADKYRFSAQWGYTEGNDTNWTHVDEWTEMDLGAIYPRTEPAGLGYYETTFRAPSSHIVLFIRGWNKWAIPDVEMDFNLDDISLTGCGTPSVASCGQPGGLPCGTGGPDNGWIGGNVGNQPMVCSHTVSAGDSLGIIANKYGAEVNDIVRANSITNPNFIYSGQELSIPGCTKYAGQMPPAKQQLPTMQQPAYPVGRPQVESGITEELAVTDRPVPDIMGAAIAPVAVKTSDALAEVVSPEPALVEQRTYTVQPGQSLGIIAQQNGVDPYALALANGISNMDFVYVGQELRIP